MNRIDRFLLTKVHALFRLLFLLFIECSLLQDRIQQWSHYHISSHPVSPGSLERWDSFSDCPVFGDLDTFETDRYTEECLDGSLYHVFSWLDFWGYGFCGRRSQWSRAIFITLYHGRILPNLTHHSQMCFFGPWTSSTEVVFVRFLHHKCNCTLQFL